jgi:hypothetical protein
VDTIESSAPPRTRTMRHIRCDLDFLELLEEDFGISQFSLRRAFMGVPTEPKVRAIRICEWAIRSAKGDGDEAGDALRAWAREHRHGQYAPHLVDAPDRAPLATRGRAPCVRRAKGAARLSWGFGRSPCGSGSGPRPCTGYAYAGAGSEGGSPTTGTALGTLRSWRAAGEAP